MVKLFQNTLFFIRNSTLKHKTYFLLYHCFTIIFVCFSSKCSPFCSLKSKCSPPTRLAGCHFFPTLGMMGLKRPTGSAQAIASLLLIRDSMMDWMAKCLCLQLSNGIQHTVLHVVGRLGFAERTTRP